MYDPYFAVTQRKTLPQAEVCVAGKCDRLSAGGTAELEFESAGVHKLVIKLSSGSETQRQNLFVEVK